MDNEKDTKKSTREEREAAVREEMRTSRTARPPGYYSNGIIRARNGGVRHQFEGDIGGCSANYR